MQNVPPSKSTHVILVYHCIIILNFIVDANDQGQLREAFVISLDTLPKAELHDELVNNVDDYLAILSKYVLFQLKKYNIIISSPLNIRSPSL